MALRRKGTRGIVVDGDRYRWRVVGPGRCCWYCANHRLSFVVEHADQRGPVMLASTAAYPLTPAVVAEAIRSALRDGWRHTEPGPQFTLRAEVHAAAG